MARDDDDADVHEGVARLSTLARQMGKASPGNGTEIHFPLFGDTIAVQVEHLTHDEVFIAVGNNRIGALYAERVLIEDSMEEVVANAVATAVHTYLRRVMRQLRNGADQVDVESTDEPTPKSTE